jgi:hypothetical protein
MLHPWKIHLPHTPSPFRYCKKMKKGTEKTKNVSKKERVERKK